MTTKFVALLLLFASAAMADQEASPDLYVVASGAWYARCVPSDPARSREEGTTRVYLARREGDTLIHSFDWYAPQLFIAGWGGGVSVVRMGPWSRGERASRDDLAFAFYRDGELLRRYSTLDIADGENKVRQTTSHYTVLKDVIGFVRIFERRGNDTIEATPGYGFEVVLHDDRKIVYDPKTGVPVSIQANMFTRRIN